MPAHQPYRSLFGVCWVLFAIVACFRPAAAATNANHGTTSRIVFAFNTKAGMYDDLPHIKAMVRRLAGSHGVGTLSVASRQRSSASSMVASRLKDDSMALIKFNQDVSNEVVASDRDDFEQFLEDLSTDSDDTCEALTLSAVMKALKISKPRSTVFIFAQGPAKDYKLLDQVVAMAMTRQTQIMFVISGQCGDVTSAGYEVYDKIASYSSGLVLRISKTELSRALRLVEATVQKNKVHLAAAESNRGGSRSYVFQVDQHIMRLVVSVSDHTVKLDTRSPSDISTGQRLVVDLQGIRVETVRDPEDGLWNVTVHSLGAYTLRVTAESPVHVNHGFHLKRLPSLDDAKVQTRPVMDIANFLYVSFTGLADNRTALLTSVDVISPRGSLLASYRLEGPQLLDGSFVIRFSPIKTPFLLRFKGTFDGVSFVRISPTLIKARLPDPPSIRMDTTYVGYTGASVILYCFIESDVPFKAAWQREGLALDRPTMYIKSVNTSLWLPAKSTAESGLYTCSATNLAGTTVKSTRVVIQVRPPIIQQIGDQSVIVGETILLRCEVFSSAGDVMRKMWHKNGHPIVYDDRVKATPNANLWISRVHASDSATYNCTASNSGGASSQAFRLSVKDLPSVATTASPRRFKADDIISIKCIADGQRSPIIRWLKNGNPLSYSKRVHVKSKNEIRISPAVEEDQGRYTCVADYSNFERFQEGMVLRADATIEFQESPSVRVLPQEQVLNEGASFSIQCLASGSPAPNITWTKDAQRLGDHVQRLANGVLHISNARSQDTGTYLCAANNIHGIDVGFGKLYVGSPPKILRSSPPVSSFPLGANVTLSCHASGNPVPFTYWLDKNDKEATKDLDITRTDAGDLIISNLSVRHTGKYVCKAQNQFGEASVESLVTATGIEPPQIAAEQMATVFAKVGTKLSLPCVVSGNPPPTVTWSRKGSDVIRTKDNSMKYSIAAGSSLKIASLSPTDSGTYVCSASNEAGIASADRRLLVTVPPTINIQSDRLVKTRHGENARLECYATGIPEPLVTWRRNGILLPHIGQLLELNDIETTDNGTYQCEAENVAGNITSSIVVIVEGFENVDVSPGNEALEAAQQEIPRFVVTPRSALIDAGETVSFFCNATGFPTPTIKWQRSVVAKSEVLEVSPDNRLVIRDARIEDSGPYSCSAENDVGTLMTIFQVLVKVDGGLGPWKEWGQCNSSCGPGFQERVRLCDSPPPRNGGSSCEGANLQIKSCLSKPCNVDGQFGAWSDWSRCSLTCGGGQQFRIRLCDSPPPSGDGRQCQGGSLQAESCNDLPCSGADDDTVTEVIGSLAGRVNGIEIVDGALMANLTHDSNNTVSVTLLAKNIPKTLIKIMRSVTSLLTPIYWSVVRQSTSGLSGVDISGAGTTRYSGQITYGSYQTLRCDAVIRPIPGNRVLMIEVKLNGDAQVFPRSHDVIPLDYVEQFIQVGQGKVFSMSERKLKVGALPVGYSFNHTFEYSTKLAMENVLTSYTVDRLRVADNADDRSMRYDFRAAFREGSDRCPFGFDKVDGYCKDVDECKRSYCDHLCINSYGSFACQCLAGFYLGSDGITCEDIDECSLGVHECNGEQECVDMPGAYECKDIACQSGFEHERAGGECVDIDECLRDDSCPLGDACHNTIGSYECQRQLCTPGYIRSINGTCTDVDECQTNGLGPCPEGESCVNTIGSHFCVVVACENGFERHPNGSCLDINECLSISGACPDGFLCSNSIGSYTCRVVACPGGLERNLTTGKCIDIDECMRNTHNCTDDQMCTNTEGGFDCPPLPCLAGYERDSNMTCVDVDECLSDPCGPGEVCQNSDGSFYCEFLICDRGYEYTLDFTACQDVDECENPVSCPRFYACVNLPGTFRCNGPTCPLGLTDDNNGSCADANECQLLTGPCPAGLECINTFGSFTCDCPAGHLMTTGGACEDVNECLGDHNCSSFEMCVNTNGSYDCLTITTPKITTKTTATTAAATSNLRPTSGPSTRSDQHQPTANSIGLDTQQPRGDGPGENLVGNEATAKPTPYFEEHHVIASKGAAGSNDFELLLNLVGNGTNQSKNKEENQKVEQSIEGGPINAGMTTSPGTESMTPSRGTLEVSTITTTEALSTSKWSVPADVTTARSVTSVPASTPATSSSKKENRSVQSSNTTPKTLRPYSNESTSPSEIATAVRSATPQVIIKTRAMGTTDTPVTTVTQNPLGTSSEPSGTLATDPDNSVETRAMEASTTSAPNEVTIDSSTDQVIPTTRPMKTSTTSAPGTSVMPPSRFRTTERQDLTGKAATTVVLSTSANLEAALPSVSTEDTIPVMGTQSKGFDSSPPPQSKGTASPSSTARADLVPISTTTLAGDQATSQPTTRRLPSTEAQFTSAKPSIGLISTAQPSDAVSIPSSEGPCTRGYTRSQDGACQDIDECLLSGASSICNGKKCVNVNGGFRCEDKCKRGYAVGKNGKCNDIDECLQRPRLCGTEQLCFNLIGSYKCVCKRGFELRGSNRKCADVDECRLPNFRVCQHQCKNTYGSFRCSCDSGYQLTKDGRNCQVTTSGSDQLVKSVIRTAPHTGYCFKFGAAKLCFCPQGYKWNQKEATCQDLMDLLGPRKKVVVAKAGTLPGQFNKPQPTFKTEVATDPTGASTSDGVRMEEAKIPGTAAGQTCPSWFAKRCVHECAVNGDQYSCTCPPGYARSYYGGCRDVNECWRGHSMCPSAGDYCFNTPGSHRCVNYTCPQGYYKFRFGYCEKSCRIGKYGYCRRSYIRYHSIVPSRSTALQENVLTLRVASFMSDKIARVQFYFTRSNSYFCLKTYRDHARMRLCRRLTGSGDFDVEINADLFDAQERLVCRTKFIVYVSVGKYNF